MKRIFAILLTAMLLLGAAALPIYAAESVVTNESVAREQQAQRRLPRLKFKQDGSFKIIQVSDLQEAFFCSNITQDWLYDLAKNEKPDLFVLAGDNIHTFNPKIGNYFVVKHAIDAYMNVFDKIYKDFGIPVTMVFGNHDAEDGGLTRAQQFEIYQSHKSFVGWASDADRGAEDALGEHYGTHNLLLYDHAGKDPVFNLWMFDSGQNHGLNQDGMYIESCVLKPQIEWFKKTNKAVGELPSMVFQHMMMPEGEKARSGWPGHSYVSNHGFFDALCETENVLAVSVGHSHVLTDVVKTDVGPDFIWGPSSGFGTGDYSMDVRGVRVITLNESDLNSYDASCIFYKGYYGDDALREARLLNYHERLTYGIILDWLYYMPMLWLRGLFG